jgi:hypothetical protein
VLLPLPRSLHVYGTFKPRGEAVVGYAVKVNGQPLLPQLEGRSVLTDDWRVTRATFCHLMRLGGVTCPPPKGG